MKIGYTCGVYDLFHIGHLNLFERCKKACDYLIVGVCDDDYVKTIKGKTPVINQNDRARIVNALKCVDEVHIIDIDTTIDKIKAYNLFHFDKLFVGDDWKGTERCIQTEKQIKNLNLDIEIVFFPYTKEVSTTMLKDKMKDK